MELWVYIERAMKNHNHPGRIKLKSAPFYRANQFAKAAAFLMFRARLK